jgi:hypothetical protein
MAGFDQSCAAGSAIDDDLVAASQTAGSFNPLHLTARVRRKDAA